MKETNNNFKEKKDIVEKIIFNLDLVFTDEDKINIQKLINSYFRKKKLFTNSKVEFIAGGLLWAYSRINFLFQYDPAWSQKEIAKKLDIKSKSISRTAMSIMEHLKIDYFDSRFARKEVAKKDPRNNFFMTKEGFILDKKSIKNQLLDSMRAKYGDIIEMRSNDEIECINLSDKKKKKEVEETKDTANKSLKDFF